MAQQSSHNGHQRHSTFPLYDFRCAGQVGAMYYCIGICHRGRTRGKIKEGSSLLGAGSHGGDEFLYLLIEIGDEQDAAVVAKKIIQAVQVACDVGGVELTVNTSIGIAIYPRDGKTVQTLIMSADAAMYRAKQSQSGYAFATDNQIPHIQPTGPGDHP